MSGIWQRTRIAPAPGGPSTERVAHANGIEVAYDTFGDRSDPVMLLVMGLGMQLIHWDPELCRLLAGRGFHVVRFDNRDVGHSTKIESGPPPRPMHAMLGLGGSASYTLEDMAADTAGLLDELGAGAAHVVGASLGGMIAQTLAIARPDRVLSLASVMSTTGRRRVAMPKPRAMRALLAPPPRDRERYTEHFVRVFRAIGSPAFPRDEHQVREVAAAGYERCFYPIGTARQLVAVTASGDRTQALRGVSAPTVVIHGREDPLIPVGAGRATARAAPGAELVEIPGMGHDLPRQVWPTVVDAVVRNARRSSVPPASGEPATYRFADSA